MSDTQSSMDSKFENSLRTPSMRAQRIFDIQDRVREIEEKVIPELQDEKRRLENEKLDLREKCEHIMPSGQPAWDDYFGKGKNEKCRICYKQRGDVPQDLGGLKLPPPTFDGAEEVDVTAEEPSRHIFPKGTTKGWKKAEPKLCPHNSVSHAPDGGQTWCRQCNSYLP